MVINENNSHINSFTKGMNSDTAFDQIDGTLYIFGENVRITKNQFLNGYNDYSSVHEGIVSPVPKGLDVKIKEGLDRTGLSNHRILAVNSIERLGTIITTTGNDIHIFRCQVDEELNEWLEFTKIWYADNIWDNGAPEKISAVLYKELQNVIKLYISTGLHPIISLRVDDEGCKKLYNEQTLEYVSVDYLINNRIIPKDRVFIEDVTSGKLTASLVQYTYRYYNKYGNTTQLAPLTNKIQVIDPSRGKETGNAESTETSVGLTLSINITDYKDKFERLQVYRLQYIIPGQDAEVSLIYDGNIKEVEANTFMLNDVGINPIQSLTMEEFAAMSGLILVPQVIEQNQEYMFCGNVKDDTIMRGVNISDEYAAKLDSEKISLVEATVVLSNKIEGDIPEDGKYYYTESYQDITDKSGTVCTVSEYLKQRGIRPEIVKASYNDMITSSLLRSLRRGETYKYAIVFYDRFGRRTDVLLIGDCNTKQYNASRPFECDGNMLFAHPIGVNIEIPTLKLKDIENLKPIDLHDIIGCQIVRRSSNEVYQRNLLQVALARPVSQALLETNILNATDLDESATKKSPYYPTGFLSVPYLCIYPSYYYNDDVRPNGQDTGFAEELWAKTSSRKLFLIFSLEIDFRRNDVISKVNTSDSVIKEMLYIPSIFALYKNSVKYTVYNNNFPEWIESLTMQGSQPTSTTHKSKPIDDGKVLINSSWINMDSKTIISFDSADINKGTLFYKDGNDQEVYGPDIYVGENIMSYTAVVRFLNTALNAGYSIWVYVGTNHNATHMFVTVETLPEPTENSSGKIIINRMKVPKQRASDKQEQHWIFNFYQTFEFDSSGFGTNNVNLIKDVKIPEWHDGFTEVSRDDDQNIFSAIKKYKSFTTNIDRFSYNNWISFCKYDLSAGKEDQPNISDYLYKTYRAEMIGTAVEFDDWYRHEDPAEGKQNSEDVRRGYIGAGPSCFLLTTENDVGTFPLTRKSFFTSICNISHNPKITDVQSDEFVEYYGFGNYFPLTWSDEDNKFYTEVDGVRKDHLTVFDGDIYITLHEFTTVYKAYDFNSVDTLQSMQVTNYIPLESKVNTNFDYGMNLKNTISENLLCEAGSVDGITTQERPAHQYNMIYSENDMSNDIFTLISTDDNETNEFKQRVYYSEPKTNGEFIDNFLIFKTAAFIDVDSKYGQITNLLTDKNNLYYWQDYAFGKFSVNERSLVNDQNSNTIMLGQAGILSRYDYVSTKYGMRLYDFCARSVETGVFWVDINNKAIVGTSDGRAINYGENIGVQNIINNNITDNAPHVDYDLLNDELLCKCFGDNQLVFNLKYNVATSIYTRLYDYILYIKNHVYGLKINDDQLDMIKYNYLDYNDNNHLYLTPLKLEFVVNPMASVTKVFDSQLMVPIKRDQFKEVDNTEILEDTTMSFETDIVEKTFGDDMEPYTDREGNIIYNVPRWSAEGGYGHRIRGKWMRVNINNEDPKEYFTLSHVITKFRQSYS